MSVIVESISTIHPSSSFNLRGHGFITCNQCTGLLLFVKQATFTPFAMYGIVGKVNNNTLLVQTVLYWKWGHAVMDDVIYRTKKHVLILIVFQDSILVS